MIVLLVVLLLETLLEWLRDAVKRSLCPWYTNVILVIVWYSPCIIAQYSDLDYYVNSRGSVVERPTIVRKVMGSILIWSSDIFWVLCLHLSLYLFNN